MNEEPIIPRTHTFSNASSIAREILAYLRDHPDARDSIEGIMQWWLLERNVVFQVTMVREALDGLVRDGSVIESSCQSGMFYKLKK